VSGVMKAIVVLRVSSPKQKEKYGPESQMDDVEESLGFFPMGKLEIVDVVRLQEHATGWNRTKWDLVMHEALNWHREGRAEVLIFPRVDRETRFMAGSWPKMLEVIRSGMVVYFASTRLMLDMGKPDTFEEYQREALEAQAYIRVMRRNTMRGKRKGAEKGNVISGHGGRFGSYIGLRQSNGRFDWIPGERDIVAEVLGRGLVGESISLITRDLQKRGVRGRTGGLVHRSHVGRILAHARVYAGQVPWRQDGVIYLLKDKLEPAISVQQAEVIEASMQKNKERSYGFGKRKWLTGRVFCDYCGARYRLDAKKGCSCNRSDKRHPNRCPAPKVGLKHLEDSARKVLMSAFLKPETIVENAGKMRAEWETRKSAAEEIMSTAKRWEAEHQRRRNALSFEHENGGLTDDQWLRRDKAIQAETPPDISPFTEPMPFSGRQLLDAMDHLLLETPGLADLGIQKGRSFIIYLALEKLLADESRAADLADIIDFKVIIGPADVKAFMFNVPTASEESRATVSRPSPCCGPRRPRPPGPAWRVPAL
jgi:hypothetical protein